MSNVTPNRSDIIDHVTKELEKKDFTLKSAEMMKRGTEKVLDRISQNMEETVKEDAYPVIDAFCKSTVEKLSNMSQKWVDNNSGDLSIFPEGTRYIFKDGDATTIVVEQTPRNRHVQIMGATYMLSMPYVQFVVSFKNGVPITVLYVGMTKKPISDLDGMIYNCILPNCDNHKVCTGNASWGSANSSMTQIVNEIIGSYWQSAFTADASQQFQNFLAANFKSESTKSTQTTIHQRLKDWQDRSKEDSTFIIHKDIKFNPGRTIRAFLSKDQGTSGAEVLVNKMKSEITTSLSAVSDKLKEMVTSVDLQTMNTDRPHLDMMSKTLKEIITLSYSSLWDFMEKNLLEVERAKMKKEMEIAAEKLKADFKAYLENANK